MVRRIGHQSGFYERGLGWEIADMNKLGSKTTVMHLWAQSGGPTRSLLAAQSSLAFVRVLGYSLFELDRRERMPGPKCGGKSRAEISDLTFRT